MSTDYMRVGIRRMFRDGKIGEVIHCEVGLYTIRMSDGGYEMCTDEQWNNNSYRGMLIDMSDVSDVKYGRGTLVKYNRHTGTVVEVVDDNHRRVMFLNGNSETLSIADLDNGSKFYESTIIGKKGVSNTGEPITIIEQLSDDNIRIKFHDGEVVDTNLSDFNAEKVHRKAYKYLKEDARLIYGIPYYYKCKVLCQMTSKDIYHVNENMVYLGAVLYGINENTLSVSSEVYERLPEDVLESLRNRNCSVINNVSFCTGSKVERSVSIVKSGSDEVKSENVEVVIDNKDSIRKKPGGRKSSSDKYTGLILKNNRGEKVEVLKYIDSKNSDVYIANSGIVKLNCSIGNVLDGKVSSRVNKRSKYVGIEEYLSSNPDIESSIYNEEKSDEKRADEDIVLPKIELDKDTELKPVEYKDSNEEAGGSVYDIDVDLSWDTSDKTHDEDTESFSIDLGNASFEESQEANDSVLANFFSTVDDTEIIEKESDSSKGIKVTVNHGSDEIGKSVLENYDIKKDNEEESYTKYIYFDKNNAVGDKIVQFAGAMAEVIEATDDLHIKVRLTREKNGVITEREMSATYYGFLQSLLYMKKYDRKEKIGLDKEYKYKDYTGCIRHTVDGKKMEVIEYTDIKHNSETSKLTVSVDGQLYNITLADFYIGWYNKETGLGGYTPKEKVYGKPANDSIVEEVVVVKDADKHLGEESIACNKMCMKIIRYNNTSDLDVMFSDGSIARHKDYYTFLLGKIASPSKGFSPKLNEDWCSDGVYKGISNVTPDTGLDMSGLRIPTDVRIRMKKLKVFTIADLITCDNSSIRELLKDDTHYRQIISLKKAIIELYLEQESNS